MKKLLVVFFSLVFLAGIAEAGPKEARLKHADKNKDGAVDAKEMHREKNWEHKQKEKAKKIFKEADVNKDGVVDENEINT